MPERAVAGRWFAEAGQGLSQEPPIPNKTPSRWEFRFFCSFLTLINPFEFVVHEAGPTTPTITFRIDAEPYSTCSGY